MEQLTEVIKEVKIDPNNPKPTELRTEENSRKILALNEQVLPFVTDSADMLKKVEKTLIEVIRRLS